MRIWIVEDNSADIYLLREALQSAGLNFTTDIASNGDQVVALLAAAKQNSTPPPDAVILDFHLVKFKGTEIIELVRAAPGLAKIPVLVLTSSHNPVDRAAAFAAGATAYFHKSLDLDDFMQMGREMAALLQSAPAASAARSANS